MPKRSIRSRATMRPVSTIRSRVSRCGTSLNGRWMVTGTTASSGDHSIITGHAGLPVALERQLGEKFGVARLGEARPVEHALGDRIGDDRGGRGPRARRRRRGRSRRSRRARWSRRAGRARRWRPGRAATTGSARAKRRGGLAGVDRSIGTSRPSRSGAARRGNAGRRERRTPADRVRRGCVQAASVMSGPMPAGSPSVSASGSRHRRGLFVFDHGLLAQFLADTSCDSASNVSLNISSRTSFLAGAFVGLAACRTPQRLDALLRGLRRGQLADLGLVQHVAQCRRQIGRALRSPATHRDVAQAARA